MYKSTDSGGSWSALASLGLPTGNSISALTVDPSRPSTLYAGSSNGIYKSTNGGGSWTLANSGLTTRAVTSLNISPTNPSKLYATIGNSDGEPLFATAIGSGVWSSDLPRVYRLVIDPSNPSTLYAATWNGVKKSIDAGLVWNELLAPHDYLQSLSISPSDPNTLYALKTFGNKIWESLDGGMTWNETSGTGLPHDLPLYNCLIDPFKPATLYVTSSSILYQSLDSGANWSAKSVTGLPSPMIAIITMIIVPTNQATLYAGVLGSSLSQNGVYKSTDGGGSWAKASGGLPTGANVRTLAVDPANPAMLYAANNNAGVYEVYKSTDSGANWTAFSLVGLPTGATIEALAVDPLNPSALYAGTDRGVYSFTTTGTGSQPVNQTISFGTAPTVSVGGTGILTATGGASGNPVVFTSITPSVCTVNGSTVTGLTVGSCSIAANQAGNANYNAAAQVTQTFGIVLQSSPVVNQTISFGATPTVSVGGTGILTATGGGSGNPVVFTSVTPSVCTVNGSTVTGVTVGTCTIAADQAGNANYNAAPQAVLTFTVSRGSQTANTPAECVMNWAEVNYPGLLAPAGSLSMTAGGYNFRYYAASGAYLGVSSADNHIYYQGPDGVLQDEGPLTDLSPKVGCATASNPPPSDCLMNWAEANYQSLFAPAGSLSTTAGGYTFRYYAASRAYLGVSLSNNHVYYLGQDGVLQDVGPLAQWLPLAGCQ